MNVTDEQYETFVNEMPDIRELHRFELLGV